MLGAREGAAPDPNDAATKLCTPPPGHNYARLLKIDGLKGARIGIPRKNSYEPFTLPGADRPRGGLNPAQTKVMDEAIAALKAAGATVVDVDVPSMLEKDPKENLLTAGASNVLSYGMKRDFNAWLASLGPVAPVKSLTELRARNAPAPDRTAPRAPPCGDHPAGARSADAHAANDPAANHHGNDDGPGGCVADASGSVSARLRAETAALRRRFHRSGVQRAEAPATGLRVRAGDEEAHAAAGAAVSLQFTVHSLQFA